MTVLLFGHRGARGLYPENTLEGFAETVAIGVDGIELDVGATADGIAVVSHDPALNPDIARAPGGRWIEAPGPLIRSLTLSELQRFDVGRARPGGTVAVVHPAQQPRDGARIPTLRQALEAIPATVPDRAEDPRRPSRTDRRAGSNGACHLRCDRPGRGWRACDRGIVRLAGASARASPAARSSGRVADTRGDGAERAAVVGRAASGRFRRLGPARRSGRSGTLHLGAGACGPDRGRGAGGACIGLTGAALDGERSGADADADRLGGGRLHH